VLAFSPVQELLGHKAVKDNDDLHARAQPGAGRRSQSCRRVVKGNRLLLCSPVIYADIIPVLHGRT